MKKELKTIKKICYFNTFLIAICMGLGLNLLSFIYKSSLIENALLVIVIIGSMFFFEFIINKKIGK